MNGVIVEAPHIRGDQIVISIAFADVRLRVKSRRRGVWGGMIGGSNGTLLTSALDVATHHARAHSVELEPLYLELDKRRK